MGIMGLYYDNIVMSNLLKCKKENPKILFNNQHYVLKTAGMIPWGRCLGGERARRVYLGNG